MNASNENSSPKVTIVRQSAPTMLDVVAIGTDLIDECALAVRLGVSRSTLQSWRYTGRGPRWIKLGRLIRYRNADVDVYLRAHTRGEMA
jgi:predicted DNA-binding transcriptional regulator AlpA